jgi:hypothetical protein
MPFEPPRDDRPRVRLRVHLVPLGYDVARAVTPAKTLRADAVILLTERRDERPRSPFQRALRSLKRNRILVEALECNLWDPPSVVDEVGNLVTAAPSNEYFFNVSTGARTAAVGGTIASMFWPIRPYYQPVAYVDSSVVSEVDAPVTGPPFFIPTFDAPSLHVGDVDTLRFLVSQSDPTSKRQLMAHMRGAETIHARTKASVSPQAFHAQTNVILRHLVAWGFVETSGHGKRLRIQATEMGRGGARMFRHMVEPRRVPGILRKVGE